MKKKMLSVLLTLCMVLTLLPTAALSVVATRPITLTVAGTSVRSETSPTSTITYWKSDTAGGITSEGASDSDYNVKYDPTTTPATLTLKGAMINYASGDGVCATGEPGDLTALTIALEDENHVTGAGGQWSNGISTSNCKLTISGDGSLTVTGGEATSGSYGISVNSGGMLTIEGGATVTANGDASTSTSYGLYGGTITIQGGATVTASGSQQGVYTTDQLIVSGGTLTATSTGTTGYAISSNLAANVSNTVDGGSSSADAQPVSSDYHTYKYVKIYPTISYDVWVGGVRVTSANMAGITGDGTVSYTPAANGAPAILTLSGATINNASGEGIKATEALTIELEGENSVTGTDATWSNGIYADAGLTIQGSGKLTATGGAASQGSYGISASDNGAITIKGSASVTARGGSALAGSSYGIFCKTIAIQENASVTASGNTYALWSTGKSLTAEGMTIQCAATTDGDLVAGMIFDVGTASTVKVSAGPEFAQLVSIAPAPTECGDFAVSGGVLNTDFSYASNTLMILSAKPLTVSMKSGVTQTTADKIVVNNVTNGANLTLSGVDIDGSETYNFCALSLADGATLNLTLSGTNKLKSNGIRAGLAAPDGTTLTIGGTGSLTATGGVSGAGIGGGYNGAGGTITVSGGTVTATGGVNGAGVGGGYGGAGGTITISGGTVAATGVANGAGIGGGFGGAGGTITISGGTVTAIAITPTGSAGIGGGYSSSAIDHGSFSTGTNGKAVIIAASIGDKSSSANWSGVIIEGATGQVYGSSITPDYDFEIPEEKTLNIGSGKTLTVKDGVTLTNSGTINVLGTLNTQNGTLINTGTILYPPSVSVAAQNGALSYADTAHSATFAVTASYFADSLTVGDYSVKWYMDDTCGTETTAPAGVTLAKTDLATLTASIDTTAQAGSYYFKLTAEKDGRSTTSGVVTLTIGRAAATDTMKAASGYVPVAGKTGAQITIPVIPQSGVAGTIAYGGTILFSNAALSGTALTFTAPVSTANQQGTITIPVTGCKNYEDYHIVVTLTSAAKTPVTVSGVSVESKTYDGSAAVKGGAAMVTDNSVPVGDLVYAYYVKDSGTDTYTNKTTAANSGAGDQGAAPKNAGYYKLVVSVPDSNENYAGKQEILFAIRPATITIKANDRTAYIGDAVPTLVSTDCTVTGLVGGDELTSPPTLAYAAAPDMSAAGTFTISASGAAVPAGGNYNADIIYQTGTLTVSAPPSPGSTPSAQTVPASSDEGRVNVSATVSGGTANITVTDAQIKEIASDTKTTGTVKVDVSGLKADEAVIPAKLVTAAAGASGSEGLEVAFSTGSVALDVTALESIGDKNITVSVEEIKTNELTAEQKATLGDKADAAIIVDVNVLVNGVKTSNFGGGVITVSAPYSPKAGEDTSKLVVWYLSDDGTIEPMNGNYNAETKCYEFTTTHLSTYVLTTFPFTDVKAGKYFYNAVAWAVANGIIGGKTADTFAPYATCTRAQTVTFLWRAMGSPEPTAKTNPFTDVKADAYYYKAVLWAVENGVTKGVTATTFAPDATVTRAQVVTFQWRAAGKPVVNYAMSFADVDANKYYGEAVRWAVSEKITDGTTATTFSPAKACTRAQIVTFLYRQLGK